MPWPFHGLSVRHNVRIGAMAAGPPADFGPRGVRANAAWPGAVRAAMLDRVMDEAGSRAGLDRDGAYRRAGPLVPMRRAAEPSEIAEVIAFLAGSRRQPSRGPRSWRTAVSPRST